MGFSHSLAALASALPTPHPATPLEMSSGFGLVLLTILALWSPLTPTTRILRAGLAPLICIAWGYLAYVPVQVTPQDRWGTAVLLSNFFLRTLELLVFFPPERNVFRVRPMSPPTANGAVNGTMTPTSASLRLALPDLPDHSHSNPKLTRSPTRTPTYPFTVAEPVPEGWTWAKLGWAASLWWSWRGIGWNYSPPLPASSRAEPYTPTSSRSAYLVRRTCYYAVAWIVEDLCASFMRHHTASDFFLVATRRYAALSTAQRAGYSIATVARVWFSLEKTHVLMSLIFVSLGGMLGYEGEIWSPWGWPPMFASLGDIWRNPGLAHMWSKAWNQYNRRVLHVFGWIGIGEHVLGLPSSGTSSRLPTPSATPSTSGRASPAHPLAQSRRATHPLLAVTANLAKSAVVFTLSGLMHDCGSLVMLIDQARTDGAEHKITDALVLTPFFICQPVALVVEATVKSVWRRTVRRVTGVACDGKDGGGVVMRTFECAVGFAWTWIWLGTTAWWFVEGMSRLGVWGAWPGVSTGRTLFGSVWSRMWP